MDLFKNTKSSGKRNEWTVVARKKNGVAASRPDEIDDGDWSWVGSPPDKENFKFEYGHVLESGIKYLCVQKTDTGLDFDEPEWVLEPAAKQSDEAREVRRLRDEIREMKEDGVANNSQVDALSEVDNKDQLQSRLEGIIAAQGLQAAENVDDVVRILDAVRSEPTQHTNPMMAMLTDADNNLELNTPTDFAMLMALPELQGVIQEGKQTLTNIKNLTGGGAGAAAANMMTGGSSGGNQNSDQVTLTQEEYERLRQQAEGGGQPDTGIEDVGGGAAPDSTADDDSFTMDEFLEENDDPEGDVEFHEEVPGDTDDVDADTDDDLDAEVDVVDDDQDDDVEDYPADDGPDLDELGPQTDGDEVEEQTGDVDESTDVDEDADTDDAAEVTV